jgi:hypothetical protein
MTWSAAIFESNVLPWTPLYCGMPAASGPCSFSSSSTIGERNEKCDPCVIAIFDVAVANRLSARCAPFCFLAGECLEHERVVEENELEEA